MGWLRRLLGLREPGPRFLSDVEIVEEMLRELRDDEERRAPWLACDFGELIQLHHGTGRYIRNNYFMWYPNNPHSKLDDYPGHGGTLDGVLDHPDHPDQRSQRVIEAIWLCLQREYEPLTGERRLRARQAVGLESRMFTLPLR